jgi:hypothetical protein
VSGTARLVDATGWFCRSSLWNTPVGALSLLSEAKRLSGISPRSSTADRSCRMRLSERDIEQRSDPGALRLSRPQVRSAQFRAKYGGNRGGIRSAVCIYTCSNDRGSRAPSRVKARLWKRVL